MVRSAKKVASIALACLLVGTAVGCNRQQSEKVNKDQTQLYIYNYNAGFGGDWINSVADEFEKKFAEVSFEENKKGVQVILDNYDAPPLVSTIKNSRDAIFFGENMDYYDLIGQKAMRDITHLVSQPTAENEDSIETKMNAYGNWGDYFKTSDNKYYALPFHEGLNGMIYDIDLFESKSLYFSKAYDSGAVGAKRWVGAEGERSHGPDGEYGTFDDGMPATYDDFFILLQRMKDKTVTPMHFAGKVIDYTTKAFIHYWATNEGEEQMMLNFTLSGQAKDLATVNSDGTVSLSSEEITPDNAWKLQQQYGKYQTLEFIKKLGSDSTNFHSLANSGSETHLMAQSTYLYSGMNNEPVAILFDGSWWQREANAIFESMETIDTKYSKTNRRFGFMPIPHATEESVGNDQIYVGGLGSMLFMNPYISDAAYIEVAEEFIKFLHTEESLKSFTKETGSTRPFAYDFNATELGTLPSFTQSIWHIHKNETILNSRSNATLLINNMSELNIDYNAFDAVIGGVSYEAPFTALKSMSVAEYFKGMKDYKQNQWKGLKK